MFGVEKLLKMFRTQELCLGKTLSLGLSADPLQSRPAVSQDSLPSSPEPFCEQRTGENLDGDTREIIKDFLLEYCGLPRTRGRHSGVIKSIKHVVDGLVEKHQIAYKGMLNRLDMENREEDMQLVTTVARELFSDGITNWGRIASLLAFGAVFSQNQTKTGQGHTVSLVAEKISSYLLSDQRDWILKNKGWDGFVNFFHVPDPESTMRNTLFALVSIASVGAIAYLKS